MTSVTKINRGYLDSPIISKESTKSDRIYKKFYSKNPNKFLYHVHDNLYRAPSPKLAPWNLKDIIKYNINHIFIIRKGELDLDMYEKLHKLGIKVHYEPIIDMELTINPNLDNVTNLNKLKHKIAPLAKDIAKVASLICSIPKSENILVHCRHSTFRTGTVISKALSMCHNMNASKAVKTFLGTVAERSRKFKKTITPTIKLLIET